MEQKYYFVCYTTLGKNSTFYQLHNFATKMHPMIWLLKEREYRGSCWTINLISWQEISEEEFSAWPE